MIMPNSSPNVGEGNPILPTPSVPNINQPVQPGEPPEGFPTPSLPDINQPVQPGEPPEGFPTPSLPDINQPVQPGEPPEGFPTPSLPSQPGVVRPPCPIGYQARTVQNNQSFTDLLLANDVSYQALRSANPNLPTSRLAPGTRYCAPPAGSRRLCTTGSTSYIMEQGDSLTSLAIMVGIAPGTLLLYNPSLAPSDFIPGRVICLP